MREVLRIAKKELHDSIVDLVKRKRLSTERKPEELVEFKLITAPVATAKQAG